MQPIPAGGAGPAQGVDVLLLFVVFGVFVTIGYIIQIFFLLTLSRAFDHCHPDNRTMEPGMVWLNLIPLFGMVWIFFTVVRLAASLRNEFSERGLRSEDDFGQNLGIWYNILFLTGAIPCIGPFLSIAGLVCFILYWVKVAGYNQQLLEDEREGSPGRDEDRDRFGRRDRKRDRDRDFDEPDDRYRGIDPDDRMRR
jgi:hypothetical protein